MEFSTMNAFNDSLDSTLFGFSLDWPDPETLYGNLFGDHDVGGIQGTTYFDSFQEPAFGSSDNLVFDSMNYLKNRIDESRAISTSNDTRVASNMRTVDPSRLSQTQTQTQTTNPSSNFSDIKRPTPYPLPSSTTTLAAAVSNSTGCVRTLKSKRGTSRNLIATAAEAEVIMRLLDQSNPSKASVCPVERCPLQRLGGRVPDFRRHLKTHLARNGENRCKGIPWEQFLSGDHPHLPKIPGEAYRVPDEDGWWIGGCLQSFSRSDALKRHLRKASCIENHRGRESKRPPLPESLT